MERKLKRISKSGIAEALAKVELYRFLNQPEEAESICLDVLAIEPQHQLGLRQHGLAITDQFTGESTDRYSEAESKFERLANPYERLYYLGILNERRAKAQLRAGRPPHTLLVLFEQAMDDFAEAEKIRPEGNDDAILHWNRCLRLLQSISKAESPHHVGVFDAGDTKPY
jgi:tetratricopeptide (TPR) repeat protein